MDTSNFATLIKEYFSSKYHTDLNMVVGAFTMGVLAVAIFLIINGIAWKHPGIVAYSSVGVFLIAALVLVTVPYASFAIAIVSVYTVVLLVVRFR